jgi:hypothetical protein
LPRRIDPLRFLTPAELAPSSGEGVPWLVRGYVAEGAITEISGPAKSAGKTTFVLRAVRAVLDGGEFLGATTARSPVVYLSEERETTLAQALGRAGLLDRDDLALLPWRNTVGHDWTSVVRAAVRECQTRGARLLVVDTLGQFTISGRSGENSASDALDALRPLQEAAAGGLAVVVVRHDRKAGGDVGLSGRGSSAFTAAVDVVVKMDRVRSSPNVRVLTALSRFEETPASLVVELTEEGYRVCTDGPPEGDTARREPTKLVQEVADALLGILPSLPEGALSDAQLGRLLPKAPSRATLRKARAALLRDGQDLRYRIADGRGREHLYWLADADADTPDR